MTLDADYPNQATLSIQFVVIGGGIAGLACAIALRRVGHQVIILEKSSCISVKSSGGCRIPPNLSKIFRHWGLEKRLRDIAIKSQAVIFQTFETGEMLGKHIWDEELLRETRGDFEFTRHADLRNLLYQTAVGCGATVRLGADVVHVDPITATVTLKTGEIVKGQVIIGADGTSGLTRKMMLDEVEDEKPMVRMNMHSTIIPAAKLAKHEDLLAFVKQSLKSVFIWFGDGRCALAYPMGSHSDYALYLYCYCANNGSDEGSWDKLVPPTCVKPVFEKSERRLQELYDLTEAITCIPVVDYPELEDWVHDSGRMVLIGEAAHPLPPGAIQEAAMTIEDGAVLAKLFSHLSSEDQISSFLYAFQDLRQPRCNRVTRKEMGDIQFMTLPPGDFQEMRDETMKAKHAAGRNVLAGMEDMEESPEWADIMEVFGYDAEDEADNWWVQWGILRERAKGVQGNYGLGECV